MPAALGVAALLIISGCVLMITKGFVPGLVTLIFALFFGFRPVGRTVMSTSAVTANRPGRRSVRA